MKLNPCFCGQVLEVRYQAVIEKSLAIMARITNYKPYPHYYIRCGVCGSNMEIKVDAITAEQRDRLKNKLIRQWNQVQEQQHKERRYPSDNYLGPNEWD